MNSPEWTIFKHFQIRIHEHMYYEMEIFNNVELSLEDFKMVIHFQKENHSPELPTLVLTNEFTSTNFEVMSFASKRENNPYSKADAFVIHSLAQKIVANFHSKINKPERPTQYFTSKDEALQWLKQYM